MVMGPTPDTATETATGVITETRDPAAAAPGEAGEGKEVQGRSLRQIAWSRLKRDKVAMTGGGIVIFLVLVAIFAGPIVALLGHPPDQFHQDQIDPNLGGLPKGGAGGISRDFLLGVEPGSGRDVFSRIVYGARVSLLIAFLATLLATILGVTMGIIAGYFGGWIDAVISRVMDVFLAFPLLLFAISLIVVLPQEVLGLERNTSRMLLLVVVIGGFSWPYIGRIIRGQTLSLREREFVEAARSMGSRSGYILFRELLPNLAAPILVYATLVIPVNIIFEASLSFLGVGVQPPAASWGKMLSTAVQYYAYDPLFMIVPGAMLFITVLSFNLFGDGLRDALDPKAH
jgi:peptide/nickel transport system permease protein